MRKLRPLTLDTLLERKLTKPELKRLSSDARRKIKAGGSDYEPKRVGAMTKKSANDKRGKYLPQRNGEHGSEPPVRPDPDYR